MKKTLALAALGLLCVGSHAFALSVQDTKNYTSLTKDGTATVNGETVTWSGNTITGLDNNHQILITLNHTWELGTNGKVDLIYATADGSGGVANWGLYAFEDGKIHGKDKDKTYKTAVEKSAITSLSDYPTGGVGLTLWAKVGFDGVHLKSQDEGTTLYSQDGLRYTTDREFQKLTVNTDYITGIAAYSGYNDYEFKNADGSWTKKSTSLNTYKVTSGETKFTNTVTADANKDIVIGGGGLLFLHTNENGQKGNVAISNDIYLGKSSSTYDSIHFGNNAGEGYTTEISGDIYLVESAAISSRGDKAVNITGKVTDKNVSGSTKADGGYTLTVKGKGYDFSGDVDVTGLTLANYGNNTAVATFSGSVTVDQLTLNAGSIMNVTGLVDDTTDSALSVAESITFGLNAVMNVTGSITLDASLINLAEGITFTSADEWTLINVTGTGASLTVNGLENWTGFNVTFDETDYTSVLVQDGNSLKLTFKSQSIPEPTTATLSLLALAGLAARRRRK